MSASQVKTVSADQADSHSIRAAEIASIREFVERNQQFLCGRVLDFGSGKPGTCREPQPYRSLVCGIYEPFDVADVEPRGRFDAILCTQVLQYLRDPEAQIGRFAEWLENGGYLVLTYPTNWDEVEDSDLWRFTRSGVETLVANAGFTTVVHERRAEVRCGTFTFPLGYGLVARKGRAARCPDQERSIAILTEKLKAREPFLYLRYGDGAIECINGLGRGRTCDGEQYSEELGQALLEAWDYAAGHRGVLVGDWQSASFRTLNDPSRYEKEYARICAGKNIEWLHFEAPLFLSNRGSIESLVRFYGAVAKDACKKVLMAPKQMAPAAKRLRAEHLVTPMSGLCNLAPALTEKLVGMDFDVLLWGCGMAGSVPVVNCWKRHPKRTYINIGSSLDPLYRGRTRSNQMGGSAVRQALGWL